MNQEFEQILDQAITLLAAGESVEFIAQKFPNYSQELLDTLPLVASLNNIAKSDVPMPVRKYKYAEAGWSWSKVSEFFSAYKYSFMPLVLVLLFAAGFGLDKISANSLPGQVLYSIKSAKELAQVTLTFDQKKLATLHMELSQKRLEEVKRAAESNNPKQELAALNNLTEQTEKTLTAVSQVATDPASENNNQELLDNLVAINKEQKTLIQAAAESSDIKEEATVALSESKETDINLAKLIITVNEQTLLDLPNKISVTGIIKDITDNKVSVEKNTFSINDQTIIVSAAGEITTSLEDIKGKITVIGTSENNVLVAKKVVIIDPDATVEPVPVISTPQVKGQITTKPSTPTTTPLPSTPIIPQSNDTIAVPQEAYGGFIAEPADSQYLQ
jgi:hypothetical protein